MCVCLHLYMCVCIHGVEFLKPYVLPFFYGGQKSDQEAGRPQGGFTFKKLFKFGAEQPIDERLAALDSEMSALDEVCKEKRKKLK